MPKLTRASLTLHPDGAALAVRLRTGEAVRLRLLAAGDTPALGDYFTGLSAETRGRFGPHGIDRATAERLCATIDPHHSLRLVAMLDQPGQDRIIAYSILRLGVHDDDAKRYRDLNLPLDPERDCTLAPSVADAYQSQGLGSLALAHLITLARSLDRRWMVLWGGTHATNARAIHYYRKHGFQPVGDFMNPPGQLNHDMVLPLDGVLNR